MLDSGYLLLYDFHHGVFNLVVESGLLESVLEVVLGGLEVLSVGVGARAQDLHKTARTDGTKLANYTGTLYAASVSQLGGKG